MMCPPTHKHGLTHTCYNVHGCRCARCRNLKSKHRGPYEWETRRRIGRDVWVPAGGTVRRLRALAVMGWSIHAIATETDLFHRSLAKVREGSRARVHLSTYQAVTAFYEHHSMNRNETREGHITATRAAANGWLPPLVWDDPDRDRTPKGAVRAIGRFNPDRPTTYRAREPYVVDAPVRATRKEAMADIRRGSVPSLFDLHETEES